MNPIRFGSVTPRPHRHSWAETIEPQPRDAAHFGADWEVNRVTIRCTLCGAVDTGQVKRGRNNRKRGGTAELEVARLLGGEKVGPLGLPEDVRIEGYARLQVKKLARLPSLSAVVGWLNAMPAGGTLRGVVVIEAGRNGRRLIVFDLDEFAERHGK